MDDKIITNNNEFELLIRKLLKEQNWLYNHIHESYNHFVEDIIYNILINEDHIFNEEMEDNKIYYDKLRFVGKPSLKLPINEMTDEIIYPEQARIYNLSYMSKLVCNVEQILEIIDLNTNEKTEKKISEEKDVLIGKIPIMVKSQYCSTVRIKNNNNTECKYDVGGYFIINGNEKVVLTLERICTNKVFIFIRTDIKTDKKVYYAQLNSKNDKTNEIQKTIIEIDNTNKVVIRTPKFIGSIPIFILMRACGIETDKDIIKYIVYNIEDEEMIDFIKYSIDNTKNELTKMTIITQDDALDFLINKLKYKLKIISKDVKEIKIEKRRKMLKELDKEFIPHLGGIVDNNIIKKGFYLGYIANKLIKCYLKRTLPDERDNYINKRLETPGILLGELFRVSLKKIITDINKYFKKKIKTIQSKEDRPNIINQIKSSFIEQGFKSALSTGTWGTGLNAETGVANILQRLTYVQTLSYLRRIITPGIDAAKNKVTSIRMIDNNQNFYICPVESQDGITIGIIKHLALSATISITEKSQIKIIKNLLKTKIKNINEVAYNKLKNMTKLLINGDFIGVIEDGLKITNELKQKRIDGQIMKTVSIIFNLDDKEINIYTDYGRLYRPLLKVENNELVITKKNLNELENGAIKTWDEFLRKNPKTIEYIDMEESQYTMVAMTIKNLQENKKKQEDTKIEGDNLNRYKNVYVNYTHAEIHPYLMLGIISGLAPFSNYNPSPRNVFNFAQTKQAMGISTTNHRYRLDISYMLHTLYKPIVTTKIADYVNVTEMPAGENVVVAIMCYTGYNQEDSIIINESAIKNGLFLTTSYKKIEEKITKDSTTSKDDKFLKPDIDNIIEMKSANYEKLNESGFVQKETKIEDGDVVIGKITPITGDINGRSYKDSSHIYRSYKSAIVDRVYNNIKNDDGYDIYKLGIRSEHKPEIGDKFACVSKNTEILTINGWKYFKNLTKEDDVATLKDDKYIYYEKPKNIFEYNNNGKMYKIQSQFVDLETTLNHKMYVLVPQNVKEKNKDNYELIEAKNIIGKYVCYKNNAINNLPNVDTFYINNFEKDKEQLKLDMNIWLNFFGIWISNGFIKYKTCMIRTGGHKKELNEILINDCKKLNLKLHYCKKSKMFNIYNKSIYSYLKKINSNKINKSLPNWVWNLSQSQCIILLDSLIYGSRHITKDGNNLYYTVSKNLVNDIQKLAFHAGYFANYYYIKNKYVIKINKCENNTQVNHEEIHEEIIDYNDKVYCCEVISGIIYVRNNGIPIWTGNSRAGQKGTCGIILPRKDMPITNDGIVPDLIINPNAIPSRMTIGQLIECIVAKYASLKGVYIEGTPFNDITLEDIYIKLKEYGFNEYGLETLYNGITGHKMDVQIFIGPTYYLRLKHMTIDKMHCLTTDHEVLTNNGWKFYDQIDINKDKACTLKNNEIMYDNIEEIPIGNYTGYIYKFEGEYYKLVTTDNHKLYSYNEKKNKNELKQAQFYYTDYDYNVNNETIYKMDDYKINNVKNMNKYLQILFDEMINNNKENKIFYNLSREQNISILTKVSYKNLSIEVCNILQIICIHAGYDGIMIKNTTNEYYSIYVNKEKKKKFKLTKIVLMENIKVFCLTVPNGIFCVKLNGNVCWTGNSRSRGVMQMLTRQPSEGRARDGGFRIGEMEKDALVAHGGAMTLQERLLDTSDIYNLYVCEICGTIATKIIDKNEWECKICNEKTNINKIILPYSYKLMTQELQSINIKSRFMTK